MLKRKSGLCLNTLEGHIFIAHAHLSGHQNRITIKILASLLVPEVRKILLGRLSERMSLLLLIQFGWPGKENHQNRNHTQSGKYRKRQPVILGSIVDDSG